MFSSSKIEKDKDLNDNNIVHTVLPNHLGGGPHGLGNPDDKTLRKVEVDVLIPKKIREKSRREKCIEEVKEFGECCKNNSLLMVINCRKENTKMQDCLKTWFFDDDFRKQCTNEYLDERSEYRRTGIGKKMKEHLATLEQK